MYSNCTAKKPIDECHVFGRTVVQINTHEVFRGKLEGCEFAAHLRHDCFGRRNRLIDGFSAEVWKE
jgi:hypothetical protein